MGLLARRWTNFERAEGQLLKPDGRSIDIGLFSVERACAEFMDPRGGAFTPVWTSGRLADKTVDQIARQGSYCNAEARGLLGALVGSGRRAPLSPEAFAAVLGTKQFTNGADAETVVALYSETATALLGSARVLKYDGLAWTAADYRQLSSSLHFCGELRTLTLRRMAVGEADAAALVSGLAASGVKTLDLKDCTSLTALPDVWSLSTLEELELSGCTSLTTLRDVSSLVALKVCSLGGCTSLVALPELSSLVALQEFSLGGCTSLVALPELSSLVALQEFSLNSCTSLTALPDVSGLVALKAVYLDGCTSLVTLPDLSSLVKLERLIMNGCTSLVTLPELPSSLVALWQIELRDCTSLVALPDVSSLKMFMDPAEPWSFRVPEHLRAQKMKKVRPK